MQSFPDHPVIRNCEATGWPDRKEPQQPVCPICGQECERVYTNRFSMLVGCDVCLTEDDAWEVPECFPERSEDHE